MKYGEIGLEKVIRGGNSVMRIATLLAILVALVAGTSVYAQIPSPGTAGVLQKWSEGPVRTDGLQRPCGPYFRYATTGPGGQIYVTFFFEVYDTGEKSVVAPYTMLNKLSIRQVKGQKVPRAKMLRSQGPPPWIEISMSPEDFTAASCLATAAQAV